MKYRRKRRICEEFSSTSELLDAFWAKHPKGEASTSLLELWRHWDMVLGQPLASLALPLGHKEHSLIVGAEDNLALQELSFLSSEILERVNAFLNEPYFDTVQLELLMGRATLNNISCLSAKENPATDNFLPVHIPVAMPAQGALGNLDIDENTALGLCYKKYVQRFGKRQD